MAHKKPSVNAKVFKKLLDNLGEVVFSEELEAFFNDTPLTPKKVRLTSVISTLRNLIKNFHQGKYLITKTATGYRMDLKNPKN